jgi:hypothetical protein
VCQGLLFIPRLVCARGELWWYRLGKTTDSSTRALWQSYQQRLLGASRRNGRSENFAYQYLRYVSGSLTCHKVLRHGASGFTSHPKEGVLRIFIALKNPSPRPGLNPRPLGPVASKLTTTPPRGPIVFINNIKQSIFVMKCCFLSGTDWILKYYLHEHRSASKVTITSKWSFSFQYKQGSQLLDDNGFGKEFVTDINRTECLKWLFDWLVVWKWKDALSDSRKIAVRRKGKVVSARYNITEPCLQCIKP